MLEDEKVARSRHYGRLNYMCAPGKYKKSDEELLEEKKRLSRDYFNKE